MLVGWVRRGGTNPSSWRSSSSTARSIWSAPCSTTSSGFLIYCCSYHLANTSVLHTVSTYHTHTSFTAARPGPQPGPAGGWGVGGG